MWLTSKNEACKVCDAKNEYIRYLIKEIDRITKVAENERAEYKRAIDRVLYKESIPAIGQGVPQQIMPQGKIDVSSLWDEVPQEQAAKED